MAIKLLSEHSLPTTNEAIDGGLDEQLMLPIDLFSMKHDCEILGEASDHACDMDVLANTPALQGNIFSSLVALEDGIFAN